MIRLSNLQKKPCVVFLMGPTASGKTDLAMKLASQFEFELVSVDSALVYKGLDIGTAKPSKQQQMLIPHRLIDIKDPSESYSVAEFRCDALREIADIINRGNIPLLVGGTMLYFKVLQEGIAMMPSADVNVREEISQQAELEGWPFMYKRLESIDPISAKRIKSNDSQRIQRALEVFIVSGKTMTQWHQEKSRHKQEYSFMQLAVAPKERLVLHQRIEERFYGMMEKNFVDEVLGLFSRGDLISSMPSIKSVGYRQIWSYLSGECSLNDAVDRAIIATRQLAKRQLTWLRSWDNLLWIDSVSYSFDGVVGHIIKELKN